MARIVAWIAVIGFGVIAIALIVMMIFGSIAASRFNQRLDAVRSTGAPMSLAELARDPIPPEANAAVFLRRARGDLEAIGKELNDVYGSEGYRAGFPDASELERIRSALEAHPEVVPLLEQAARSPDSDSEPDYSVGATAFMAGGIERLQEVPFRSAARLLKARVLLLQSQGKHEEALESGILMLRLSRHAEREPTLVAYLVAQACRGMGVAASNGVLRGGPVPAGVRRRLDTELALHEGVEAFQWAIVSERAFGMENWQAIPARNWWPMRIMWDDDQTAYLDMIDQHLASASQPYAAVPRADPASTAPMGRRAVLTQLAAPAILAARGARDSALAEIRCLRVLNALQALDHQGGATEPKLTELGLPIEATLDPFTGESLKLKKRPDGWLIYAVGQDLIDGGGDFDQRRDVGVAPLRPPDRTSTD
ncbi:hypothetical protein ACFL5Q_01665 [Planctomycetota bacterium]